MDYIIVPIIWIVLIILFIAFIASNIVIVPQAKAYVIERLGTYRDTWSTACISRCRCLSALPAR